MLLAAGDDSESDATAGSDSALDGWLELAVSEAGESLPLPVGEPVSTVDSGEPEAAGFLSASLSDDDGVSDPEPDGCPAGRVSAVCVDDAAASGDPSADSWLLAMFWALGVF